MEDGRRVLCIAAIYEESHAVRKAERMNALSIVALEHGTDSRAVQRGLGDLRIASREVRPDLNHGRVAPAP
jgi:hypothetical protein